MKKTMDYEHPQWTDFLNRLSDILDLRETPDGKFTWNCEGNLNVAVILLKEFDADLPSSVKFFQSHGGYCDCEILFNVVKPDVEIDGKLLNPN